jgi:hypothetical protein
MTKEGPLGGSGKWAERGVPHRGWSCIDIEDLGAPDAVCEMCERQDIRYVHYMQHPSYPNILRCGCVCAGYMEEDLVGARNREKTMRGAAARRRTWPNRKGWKTSVNGNLFIDTDGFHIAVFRKGDTWSGVISQPSTGFERYARLTYPTDRQAKLAAFDAMMFIKARQSEA